MFTKLIAEKKLHEGSVLAYVSNGKILKTGIATSKGIKCLCRLCDSDSIFGVTAFEDHAGSGHRRPTKHIFVHDDQEGGYDRSLDMLKSGNLGQIQSAACGDESLKGKEHQVELLAHRGENSTTRERQVRSVDHEGETSKGKSENLGQIQSVACGDKSLKGKEHQVELMAHRGENPTTREHQVRSVDHEGETSKGTELTSQILTFEENYIICNSCSLRERRGQLPFCSRESIADGRLCCPKRICRECRSPLCERTTYSLTFQKTLDHGEKWNPLLNCDQCGDTYHSGCLHKRRSDLHERNSHIGSFQSFCSADCEKISMIIGELVQCSIPHQGDIPQLTVVKWSEELFLSFLACPEPSVDTLHSLGHLRALYAQKLFYAMDLLRKTFLDTNTSARTSLVKKMLYNYRSTQSDLDYNGFFVVLIEEYKEVTINKNKPKEIMLEVSAAATIRIHSQKVVEMPFITTSESGPGQPLFPRFILRLDEMLKQLGLLKWVVQSPPEFEDMWKKFSFNRVSLEFMTSLLNKSNLLQLEDTAFMCKDIQGTI